MAGESLRKSWTIIARAFRTMYDHMGLTMWTSTVWLIAGVLPAAFTGWVFLQAPLFGAFLVFAVTVVGLSGPVTAAVYAMTDAVIQREPVGLRDFFSFLRAHYLRAAGLTAALLALLVILVVDIVFFRSLPYLWAQYLVFLWLYFMLFLAFATGYAFPLAVRKKARLFPTLKTAVLLAADNLVVSLIVALTAVAFSVIALYLPALFVLFAGGTFGFLYCVALEEVMKKYSALRRDVEAAGGDQEAKEEISND